MSKVPFQLPINCIYPNKEIQNVLCKSILRDVPGKRKVYDASWDGREVVVKIFFHKLNAKRHLNREWYGLTKLFTKKLNAPEPLFFGHTNSNQWTLVIEKITDASTGLEYFQKLNNPADILEMFIRIGRELARQNIHGVIQKDLHLENFLLKDDKVFLLDTAQMKFRQKELDRNNSISQLAMLATLLPEKKDNFIKKLCFEYFKIRRWNFEKEDEILFHKKFAAHWKQAINRGLRKTLRSSKRYVKLKYGDYRTVFRKSFFDKPDITELLRDIDSLILKGQILKNGNTCFVSHLKWKDKDIVVKRYNHKGFFHSLRHTIKGTRAKFCWLHGHRLGMLNIATPEPVAYLERRKGVLIWDSFLITKYTDGIKYQDFLRDESILPEHSSNIQKKINRLFEKLDKNRITHGDLKHTNILISEDTPVLIDLDSMKVHRFNWLYRIKRVKDINRFNSK